ncbi:MAG: cytochrome c [Acidobacteriaceae bacterium]|nr:cytochrome c [Acidobacteriaceae bacterium]MBV8571066.1 cytochrome c [Acidobacteriaceae bacterium]
MRFILGVIVGLALVVAGVYCYFYFGYAPVATAAPPIPFELTLAHVALNARIDKEAPKSIPFQAADADLQDAAHLYREHCAMCHGTMTGGKTATAKGMFPQPPQLLAGKGVTDDPAGETYWKVSNGIRLTGMPSYKNDLSDKQMWEISQLLAGADKLPADVQEILQPPPHND